MRWMVLIVVATSCGRFRFEDLATIDAPDDGHGDAPCVLGPWGSVRALTELDTASDEFGPWLSQDRLQILWSSDRTGEFQLFTAQRPSLDASFGAATIVPLGSGGPGDAYESPDGLSLWLDESGQNEILFASRSDPAAAFSTPVPRADLAVGHQEYNPALTLDQLTIGFDTAESTYQIYFATRATPDDLFSAPQNVSELEIGAENCCVTFSGDDSFLLFASDAATPGSLRVYESDGGLSGLGTPFAFAATGDAGSGAIDADPYVTPDNKTVIFASTRAGGLGETDLYEIDRDCE